MSTTASKQTAEVRWLDVESTKRIAQASGGLLDQELYRALPQRVPHRYPKQRNYHGLYYFSQVGHHVWHESILEATTLRWLDLHAEVVAIAAQPFTVTFADDTRHTPDYMALLGDHRQVVYDVKPTELIKGEIVDQFEKTRAMCEAVGWGYEIHSELPKQVHANLSYIAAFKHHLYYPGDAATSRLLAGLGDGLPLTEAAVLLELATLAQARSAIFHLICRRILRVDLTLHLNSKSTIERNSDVRL